jgi:hypothetical protein
MWQRVGRFLFKPFFFCFAIEKRRVCEVHKIG